MEANTFLCIFCSKTFNLNDRRPALSYNGKIGCRSCEPSEQALLDSSHPFIQELKKELLIPTCHSTEPYHTSHDNC